MADDIKNEVFNLPDQVPVPVAPPAEGMKQIFAVITVARQIEGEYVFIKTEKGFHKASSADSYLQKMKKSYTSPEGHPIPQKVSTPQGDANCICTVGAFVLEIEDNG